MNLNRVFTILAILGWVVAIGAAVAINVFFGPW